MDPFDAALAELAAALAGPELHLYDQLATVTRPGVTSDGMGGTTDAETPVAADVPCLVEAGGFTREEREMGAAITASKLWTVSIPLAAVDGWTIQSQDVITVDGVCFEVQNRDAGAGHAVELVATCVRLG